MEFRFLVWLIRGVFRFLRRLLRDDRDIIQRLRRQEEERTEAQRRLLCGDHDISVQRCLRRLSEEERTKLVAQAVYFQYAEREAFVAAFCDTFEQVTAGKSYATCWRCRGCFEVRCCKVFEGVGSQQQTFINEMWHSNPSLSITEKVLCVSCWLMVMSSAQERRMLHGVRLR